MNEYRFQPQNVYKPTHVQPKKKQPAQVTGEESWAKLWIPCKRNPGAKIFWNLDIQFWLLFFKVICFTLCHQYILNINCSFISNQIFYILWDSIGSIGCLKHISKCLIITYDKFFENLQAISPISSPKWCEVLERKSLFSALSSPP